VKRSDATVLAVVCAVGVIAAFWFVVLAPKRSHASELQSQVDGLQTQLETQQQTISTAEQAKAAFGPSYQKLVVLGKAVPADSEQASLLVQLNTLAERSGVSFRSLTLNQESATAPPVAAAATTSTTSTDTTSTTSTDTTSTTSTDTTSTGTTSTDPAAAAAATEASAATLPLGVGIGAAGLPVMPYDLTFTGGYFQISKFLRGVDSLVHTPGDGVTVSGRLLTVNSFNLAPITESTVDTAGAVAKSAGLQVDLSVTTYVTPADQGLTGGATPTAPAAATASTAVPTSAPAAPAPPAPTTP
jgi:Tfp pilus assembly protein PilO